MLLSESCQWLQNRPSSIRKHFFQQMREILGSEHFKFGYRMTTCESSSCLIPHTIGSVKLHPISPKKINMKNKPNLISPDFTWKESCVGFFNILQLWTMCVTQAQSTGRDHDVFLTYMNFRRCCKSINIMEFVLLSHVNTKHQRWH